MKEIDSILSKIRELVNITYYLKMDWNDLGWDSDGCPDGEKCEDFDETLATIEKLSKEINALI